MKRQSPVPVTTGEIWSVWIEHPELASAVDFIAAHILPYWEGVPTAEVVDRTIQFYDKLRRTHPGKRIVIAEFGWPSAGYNMLRANPGRIEQATVLRDFISRAEAYGIDYNIIEAFDQPWKTNEGSVGMYWGLFDAHREPKFSWVGLVQDRDHWKVASLALLLGLLLSLPILAQTAARRARGFHAGRRGQRAGAWLPRSVCVLGEALFRARLRFRAGARHCAPHPADRDCAQAHRGDRSRGFRPPSPPPDRDRGLRQPPASRRRSRFTFPPIVSRRKCSRPRSMRSPGSTIQISNASL